MSRLATSSPLEVSSAGATLTNLAPFHVDSYRNAHAFPFGNFEDASGLSEVEELFGHDAVWSGSWGPEPRALAIANNAGVYGGQCHGMALASLRLLHGALSGRAVSGEREHDRGEPLSDDQPGAHADVWSADERQHGRDAGHRNGANSMGGRRPSYSRLPSAILSSHTGCGGHYFTTSSRSSIAGLGSRKLHGASSWSTTPKARP
jgi:hypothetical protein